LLVDGYWQLAKADLQDIGCEVIKYLNSVQDNHNYFVNDILVHNRK